MEMGANILNFVITLIHILDIAVKIWPSVTLKNICIQFQ